jgi:hypothetical protein
VELLMPNSADDLNRIVAEIRRLKSEAEGQSFERPGMVSLAVNHPGILAYQVKTQPHYERDMRQATWLDGVEGLREQDPAAFQDLARRGGLSPELIQAMERRGELKTPYWNRGVLASGQPLRNCTDWFQSVASSGINAGRMIAGVDGADMDFEQSANRMLGGIPMELTGKSGAHQYAWEREREDAAARPIEDLSFVEEPTQSGARILPRANAYEQTAMLGMSDGDTVTTELGMQAGPMKRAASMGIDMATDPVNELGVGIRALLKGQLGKASGALAAESALPATFYGLSEAMRREQAAKEVGYAQSR